MTLNIAVSLNRALHILTDYRNELSGTDAPLRKNFAGPFSNYTVSCEQEIRITVVLLDVHCLDITERFLKI